MKSISQWGKTTRFITQAATVSAMYVLLSLLISPISSGLIQCRLSEALTVLPYFSLSAVPGVSLGCLLYNILSGAEPMDVLFGSAATLVAAFITYGIGKLKLPRIIAPLPSVVINGFVVGALLTKIYGVPVSYPVAVVYVAAGQAIACYAVGFPLMLVIEKYHDKLFGRH